MSRRLPPPAVRRLITVPLTLAVGAVVLLGLPAWLLLAAFGSPLLPGRWRPLRLLWFAAVWLACECGALANLGWLWIRAGGGRRLAAPRWQDAHYRLLRRLLDRLHATARYTFALRVQGSSAGRAAIRPDRPLVVLCRHAGPGDSLLLVRAVLTLMGRRPRIVLKDALQLDPTIDILLNRVPNHFVTPSPAAGEQSDVAVGELAEGLAPGDAVVIFPEGANFTERRRLRSIDRLRRLGRTADAVKAERMRYLLAPRPGGTMAALDAAPTADVMFVAHVGLEQLVTVGDVWRALPMDRVVEVCWWHVPAEEVPRGDDLAARVDWLFAWWSRLDAWIATRRDPAGPDGEQTASRGPARGGTHVPWPTSRSARSTAPSSPRSSEP